MLGDAPEEAPGRSRLYSIGFRSALRAISFRRIACSASPSFGIPRIAQISSGVSRT